MILKNTEELHENIDSLCMRVRELEEALRVLQASVSSQPHPLLKEELQIKLPDRMDREVRSSSGTPSAEDEEAAMVDSLGMFRSPFRQSNVAMLIHASRHPVDW